MKSGHVRLALVLLVLLALLFYRFSQVPQGGQVAELTEEEAAALAAADGLLFCFWNVENFFDDQDDKRGTADEPYDNWFATERQALEQKLDHLCRVLLKMNDGRGPDILALVEVESVRAAELLKDALNQRLNNPVLNYRHVLMKNLHAGRHIAPAIITRLPAYADRTKLLGKRQRILEGHIQLHGHELVVLATHWTSRLTDEKGDARARYADQIYGAFRAMHSTNPDVDVLICGDFNDPPDAESVTKHLHAAAKLGGRSSGPRLLNLLADKDPDEYGTHYYRRWWIFDQIVVSPGMLEDAGWRCDPQSLHVERSLHRDRDKQRRPWRFGDHNDKGPRGYSDHFPVTVRLRVQGS